MDWSAVDFERKFPFQDRISTQIHFLLGAAVRAPSTHNSQPWRFKIENERLSVYRDIKVKLPQSDSVGRYSYISIGFLLQHVISLGTWLAMDPRLKLVLDGDKIAEITFSEAKRNGAIPPAIEAIFKRKNRRGVFESALVSQSVLDEAVRFEDVTITAPEIRTLADKEKIARLAGLTATVMQRVYARPSFRREMSRWITPTGSTRKDGLPGYSLNQPMIMSWILPTLIRFVNMGKVLARLNQSAVSSAPAAFGFGAPDTPSGWISTGFAASHAVLTLIAHGFDYSVFVAPIEYDDTRQSAGSILGLQQPLEFFFVAGSLPGKVTWTTPRISVDKKIIHS